MSVYSLPYAVAMFTPPAVKNGNIGADAEMPDPHIQVAFRVVGTSNFGAWRNTHLYGGLKHLVVRVSDFRGTALTDHPDAH